jgi:hypothetical protein
MGRKPKQIHASDVEQLRQGIEEWRKTRVKRTAMPDQLWQGAVAVARKHGIYAAARDLRISYDALKARVDGKRKASKPQVSAFVKLEPVLPLGVGGSAVELVSAGGAKLTIRLAANAELDMAELVRDFWRQAK